MRRCIVSGIGLSVLFASGSGVLRHLLAQQQPAGSGLWKAMAACPTCQALLCQLPAPKTLAHVHCCHQHQTFPCAAGFDVRLILTKHQPRPVLSVQDQISAGAAVPTAAPPAQPPAPAAVPKLGAAAAAAKPASKPSAASTVSSSGSTQQQAVRSSTSAGESSTLQGERLCTPV